MKILHATKKYPPALGGDAVVVAQLQKQQHAAGNHTVIVTSNCDEIKPQKSVYKVGLKDTPTGLDGITLRRIISLFVLALKMFRIVRRERPTVIHTHSVDMAFFVSFAARLYHVPVVHTFHIVTFYDPNQSFLRRISELWLARHAHLARVTAPNTYDVQKLRNAGLAQTVLLPNGVDIDFWEKNSEMGQQEVYQFLAVGRLERQKGYEYLIRAVSLLARISPLPFHVTIVGEGSEKARLRHVAKQLKVEEYISLVGYKTAGEVRALMSMADTAVFPSLYETTPLTLLEAWAASVPVITTPVGILRDAPSDTSTCRIVPLKDEEALMHAMLHFMQNESARRSFAENAREEVRQYSWPIVSQTAAMVYRSAE